MKLTKRQRRVLRWIDRGRGSDRELDKIQRAGSPETKLIEAIFDPTRVRNRHRDACRAHGLHRTQASLFLKGLIAEVWSDGSLRVIGEPDPRAALFAAAKAAGEPLFDYYKSLGTDVPTLTGYDITPTGSEVLA